MRCHPLHELFLGPGLHIFQVSRSSEGTHMTIAWLTARFLANSHLSWFVWDERDIQNQWSPGPKNNS